MLVARGITKQFPTQRGALTVLRDVSLELNAGDAIVVMGPSGSGKSTLLNILGTLERPTNGTVTIDGTNPFALDDQALARFRNQRIGFIFQEHHLLPQCTVLENVLLPTIAGEDRIDRSDRARSLLEQVGLSERMDHTPAELSGGERQRVALARALIMDPAVVLADEPTGNLDRRTADAVADLMIALHGEASRVLIVVTHSDRLAERFERIYEVDEGRLSRHPADRS